MTKIHAFKILVALTLPSAAFATGWWVSSSRVEVGESVSEVKRIDVVAAPTVTEETKTAGETIVDPALAELNALAKGEWPDDAARKLVELVGADPALVAKLLKRLSVPEQVHPIYAVAASWTSSDPAAAVEWIESLPESDLASNARSLALCVWSDLEPAAAHEYFCALDAVEKRSIVDMALGGELTRPFDQATDREYGYTHEQSLVANILLRTLPAERHEEILTLMEASKLEDIRRAAKRARVASLVDEFPGDTSAVVAAAKKIGWEEAVLDRIATKDPATALALAEETNSRSDRIIHRWATIDPDAALAAIPGIADYVNRLRAMNSWRNVILKADPKRVIESFAGEELEPTEGNNVPNLDLALSRRAGIKEKAFDALAETP
jgi:hypothetical protein